MKDGAETIAAVQDFLTTRVLPHVPADVRGELRAAVKVLGEASRELSEKAKADREDYAELVAELNRRGVHLDRDLGERVTDPPDLPLSLRQEVNALVLREILRLQDDLDANYSSETADALTSWYRLLEERAVARASWQSVFSPPLPSGSGDSLDSADDWSH